MVVVSTTILGSETETSGGVHRSLAGVFSLLSLAEGLQLSDNLYF